MTNREIDRKIAELVCCPEPPLSERRAIHESGAWQCAQRDDMFRCEAGCAHPVTTEGRRLISARSQTCQAWKAGCPSECPAESWYLEPASFSTDPAASYRLMQKLRASGAVYVIAASFDAKNEDVTLVRIDRPNGFSGDAKDQCQLRAVAIATLRAFGVEVEDADADTDAD